MSEAFVKNSLLTCNKSGGIVLGWTLRSQMFRVERLGLAA